MLTLHNLIKLAVLISTLYVLVVFGIFFGLTPDQYPDTKLFSPFAAILLFVAQPFLFKLIAKK